LISIHVANVCHGFSDFNQNFSAPNTDVPNGSAPESSISGNQRCACARRSSMDARFNRPVKLTACILSQSKPASPSGQPALYIHNKQQIHTRSEDEQTTTHVVAHVL
jgi:hypothetical protein